MHVNVEALADVDKRPLYRKYSAKRAVSEAKHGVEKIAGSRWTLGIPAHGMD